MAWAWVMVMVMVMQSAWVWTRYAAYYEDAEQASCAPWM